jgi:hypothetical protein
MTEQLPGLPHSVMEDDVYKGMFIPKGAIILANALFVPICDSTPLDADYCLITQEYGS